MAAGKGKQKLYIIPSKELLIVQLAEAEGYNEQAFLERFFSKAGTEFKDRRNNRRNAIPSDPNDEMANATNQSQLNTQISRLRLMDTNGDQQLSKEEAEDWRFFDEVDANHDGVATSEEIRNF